MPTQFAHDPAMLRNAGLEQLTRNYILAARSHRAANSDGDVRSSNIHAENIGQICKALTERGIDGQQIIIDLLQHPDVSVRGWAACHAVNFAPQAARQVLQDLQGSHGFWGTNAEMVLRRWREGPMRMA